MRLFEVEGGGVARDTEVIFQVLDSVVPDGEGSYLAAPISTGRRYFQALANHGVHDFPSLLAIIGEDEYLRTVRWPNVTEGEAVATRLRQQGVRYLINTGPIFIREWDGRDYMNLCLKLIERKVKAAYFHPEWAYSAGAVEEFLFCAQRGITLSTPESEVLTLEDGRTSLESVRTHLQSLSYPTDVVDKQLAEIDKLIGANRERFEPAASVPYR
jgi:hypothetical protein